MHLHVEDGGREADPGSGGVSTAQPAEGRGSDPRGFLYIKYLQTSHGEMYTVVAVPLLPFLLLPSSPFL